MNRFLIHALRATIVALAVTGLAMTLGPAIAGSGWVFPSAADSATR